jgi:hypothetical protein
MEEETEPLVKKPSSDRGKDASKVSTFLQRKRIDELVISEPTGFFHKVNITRLSISCSRKCLL